MVCRLMKIRYVLQEISKVVMPTGVTSSTAARQPAEMLVGIAGAMRRRRITYSNKMATSARQDGDHVLMA